MRGGSDQLIDIPAAKIAEAGTSYDKIFKSVSLSDSQLKEIIKNKIIDPVGLAYVIKQEIGNNKPSTSTSKSWGVYIDMNEKYVPGEKLNKGERIVIDLRKYRVEKIESILRARGARV